MSFWEQLLGDAIPYALAGALTGVAISITRSSIFSPGANSHTGAGWTRNLQFQPEAFDLDTECAVLFQKLQKFRPLASYQFDEAGMDADSLLCLKKQLLNKEVQFDPSHPRIAFRYLRQMSSHLNQFLARAKQQLFTDKLQGRRQEEVKDPDLTRDLNRNKKLLRDMYVLCKDIEKRMQKHMAYISSKGL